MKYRKKPIEIEAVPAAQVMDASPREWEKLPDWVSNAYTRGDIVFESQGLRVKTNHGNVLAKRGDFLICGMGNEVYPCSKEIFEVTYEIVADEAA